MKVNFVADADEPEAGQIFAHLIFDGHSEKCFWDTGATSTKVVSNYFFAKYPIVKEGELAGLAGKGVSAARIQIRNISWGNYSLGQHEVMLLSEKLGISPTAGIDLFKENRFGLDSKTQEVSFEKQDASLTFELGTFGHILVSPVFNGLRLHLIWDTGAGLTTIDQKVIDENPSIFSFIKSLDVGDTVHAKAMQLKLYEATNFAIGSVSLKKVQVLGADFSSIKSKLGAQSIQGALGYNVITHFSWYFDLQAKKYSVR
ncbi:aspartyl protease family protein [Bdellovibrio sp. 22V]|uniref:aspartyl protease family protein n=1 Tax=Bdellovibrio sp. 22V TaxID=3044166 RepID=UPI0025437536|nr:aspartyl protease family protein [Bdellovibrio sp. 22V]WII73401.1 aspartyl protease family protein [Bdellovibrio sp. 22V]